MSLEAPKLDTRTFADLVKEARDRIPRFTPDWTNFNDADPGMTLVKLQAWLTETLLYEVNRLPELNYIKFLQMLNVTPEPATAATTELQFTLKKLDRLDDPLQLFIPKNAQIEADDPDLTQPVIFETDRTLTALNAVVATIIVSDSSNTQPLSLVTNYDAKKAVTSVSQSFYPFGENPVGGEVCLIGLLLRPHRKNGVDYSQDIFPAGELDLTVSAVEVFEKDDAGEVISGPLGKQCLLAHELLEQQDLLTWQVYVSSNPDADFENAAANAPGWKDIVPPIDESAGLSRSGHLRPVLPEDISQISLQALPRSFWIDLGLKKPPATRDELLDDLEDPELQFDVIVAKGIPWEDLFPIAMLDEVIGNCESIDALIVALQEEIPTNVAVRPVEPQLWLDLEVGYSDPPVPQQAMAWIRVRLNDSAYQPTLLKGFFLNTVPATAAVTRVEETLGNSDGRPAQQFTLARAPVYFFADNGEADIQLDVVEAGKSVPWKRVGDFFAADSHAEVFQLDEATGTITFGDGVYGRIPVAGAAIVARRYRYGGGAQGNVGANTVTKVKTSLSMVDSVTNLRSAVGGSEVETIEHAKLRAPHELKTRDRAVTAEDFVVLAKQTPGVPVHTAYALAQRALVKNDSGTTIEPRDGAVTVVILPANGKQETPQPSEAQLDAVCRHLNQRRLITTELYVTGPRYLPIESLALEVRVTQSADLQAVSDGIYAQLLTYFHPLHGGEEGQGWPFGEDVYLGNVYDQLLDVSGVKRVVNLRVKLEGDDEETCDDLLTVPEGTLLHLRRDRIQLQVVYDRR